MSHAADAWVHGATPIVAAAAAVVGYHAKRVAAVCVAVTFEITEIDVPTRPRTVCVRAGKARLVGAIAG